MAPQPIRCLWSGDNKHKKDGKKKKKKKKKIFILWSFGSVFFTTIKLEKRHCDYTFFNPDSCFIYLRNLFHLKKICEV